MSVAGHHLPIWFDEATGPAEGEVPVWNPATSRFETAAVVDSIPPGTYVPNGVEVIDVFDPPPPLVAITGDNSLADDARLQALINASAKRPLSFRAGSYTFGPLTAVEGLTMYGPSAGNGGLALAVEIALRAGSNADLLTIPSTVKVVQLFDLALEGNKASQTGTSSGVKVVENLAGDNVSLRIERCSIRHFLTDGVTVGRGRRLCHIVNSEMAVNGRDGVRFYASDGKVMYSEIGGNSGDGIGFYSAGCRAIGCDIYVNNSGVRFDTATDGNFAVHNLVALCHIDQNLAQGVFAAAPQSRIVGNVFMANGVGAGSCHVNVSDFPNISIIGNHFGNRPDDTQQSEYDIKLQTNARAVVSGNTTTGTGALTAASNSIAHSNAPERLTGYNDSPDNPGYDSIGWGIPFTFNPTTTTSPSASQNANRAHYYRVQGGGKISKLAVQVGTASGNICLAVCRGSVGRNPPTSRTATTGSVPCPAAGYAEVALTAAVFVDGRTDWFAFAADNTSATIHRVTSFGMTSSSLGTGFVGYQETAFPIPSPPASIVNSLGGFAFQIVGVA